MFKKQVALFLSLILIFGLFPVSANAETKPPFTDIEHWGKEAIIWGFENELVEGINEEIFAPNATMNRAMAITILFRYNAKLDSALDNQNDTSEFTDVPINSYFYSAVVWGKKNGIINGTSESMFTPYRTITRQEFMVMLYRYNNIRLNINEDGGNQSPNQAIEEFRIYDSYLISGYAVQSVIWAYYNYLVQGDGSQQTMPQKQITRAQAVTMLERYHQYRNTETALFDIDEDDVELIKLSKGWGGYQELTSTDDIHKIVKKFNNFKYRGKERVGPTVGFAYTISIVYKDTAKPTLDIIVYSGYRDDPNCTFKINHTLYYEEEAGYFTTDWIEEFFNN